MRQTARAVAALAASSLLMLSAAAQPAQPHGTSAHASRAALGAALASALKLSAEPAPLAARYAVTVTPRPAAGTKRAPLQRHHWYFFRDTDRIALLKGNIDEMWHRDARGNVAFERVFHDDQRVVDYSAGELATLGVQVDWTALSSFVDPAELAGLRVVSRAGRGDDERIRLDGIVNGRMLTVDWRPALQLPASVLRTGKDGSATRIVLEQHAAVAPPDWPAPSARSADYLHLDAADFGDMDGEPVVKKSEALDVRGGWRSAHAHE